MRMLSVCSCLSFSNCSIINRAGFIFIELVIDSPSNFKFMLCGSLGISILINILSNIIFQASEKS
ncbi:hypothetical protein JGUZn3_14220 [Entomobacter blattae]|uniref:Uncharacterized protein n=1 Tax=Entomobacter blattae TaxID=2762277 RepID=A0A7H1NS87_9PROT|nr:hypothetical protein JGUZn3_14220 [Entomobacter blattae]